MSAAPQEQSMSVEAYFALEAANPDIRYEYLDGDIIMMAGGSLNHSLISVNIIQALRETPCMVFNSDARVQLNDVRYVYPDVTISCSMVADETTQTLLQPTMVIEVLSPGTASYDRGRKLQAYRACPSITTVLLIAQDHPQVEVYRRQPADMWSVATYGMGEEIVVEGLGVTLPVAQIYHRVTFANQG